MSAQTPHALAALRDAWNNPKKRSLFFQVLAVALVVAFFAAIIHNTSQNLQRQNIATGFGFLNDVASFSINQHLIPYTEEDTYGRVYWVGLLNTLRVALLGIVAATVLGFIIGVARLSTNWVVARLATVYIETVRNIPLLLQIFLWYFATVPILPQPKNAASFFDLFHLSNRGFYFPVPQFQSLAVIPLLALLGGVVASFFVARWAKIRQNATGQTFPVFSLSCGLIIALPAILFLTTGVPATLDVPEFKGFNFHGGGVVRPSLVALFLALSIYTAAFIAEIVRAGILAVSKGQTEASAALGLTKTQTLRLVVIPQAMRVIIPPLANQFLNLSKNSSLAVAISYPDLVAVFAGTALNNTGQAVEILLLTMLTYLALSLLTAALMNWFNARTAIKEQ